MYLKAVTIRTEAFPTRERYPFNIRIFQTAQRIEIASPVTFLAGANGSGKSALLDAIARRSGLLPWGGTKVHRSHDNPYETQLANYLALTFDPRHRYGFHFRAEAFFNFAASLDDIILDDPQRYEYFGSKSLNVLSHGESFLAFFRSYSFQLDGLYLMDEPEAALSPQNQVEFARLLVDSLNRGRKQYLIATHSPILLACPSASILSLDDGAVRSVEYRDSNHYRFYRDFLNDPARFFSAPEPGESS